MPRVLHALPISCNQDSQLIKFYLLAGQKEAVRGRSPGRIDALVFEGHLQVSCAGVLGFSSQYLAAGRVCQSHTHPLCMLVGDRTG